MAVTLMCHFTESQVHNKHLVIMLIAFSTIVVGKHSLADPVMTVPTIASSNTVFMTLVLCGMMGLLGQGCRVVVGMATMITSKAIAPSDNQDVFDLARLIFSLIIGFLAGLVTALVQWKTGGIDAIDVSNFNSMFEFAIAGYIGADIIEAFTVQYFEKNHAETGSSQDVISKRVDDNHLADVTSIGLPTPQAASLHGTLTDVHSLLSSVADMVGDTTSPTSKFKAKAPIIMSQLISDFQLSDIQAAGILGNIGVECTGFTQMQEINPVGGGLGGYGWAQWTGPRRRQFMAWCQANNLDKDSDEGNYGFLKEELSTNYKRVIVDLKKTKIIEDATTVFLKEYEGAGVPATARRISWANIALTAFGS